MEKAAGAKYLFNDNLVDEGTNAATIGRVPRNDVRGEVEKTHFGSVSSLLQGHLGTYRMTALRVIPVEIDGFKVFGSNPDFPLFDILQNPQLAGITTDKLLRYDTPETDLE